VSPKKIAIVTPTFPPYRGGIGKVAEMDAAQLAASGFEVVVFTLATDTANDTKNNTTYSVRRIKPIFSYGNAGFCPQLAKIWSEFDLVMLHYPFYGGAEPLVWGKPKSGGAKLALVYHMDTVGKGLVGAFFDLHKRFLMPWIIKKADVVIGTTSDYLRHSQARAIFEKYSLAVRELPPSVDIDRFKPRNPDSELLVKHCLGQTDKIILFVGGLDQAHYFKGISYLLRALAAKELSGVKAVIVGRGNMREEYERLAEKIGLSGRVIFSGGVSEINLPKYYNLVDAFVFPSVDKSEAFGIAALEAMSSGVPVVASDLPGVCTIVRDGETGYRSEPRNISSLVDRLAKLLNNDDSRRKFGENARKMAVEEYSDIVRAKKIKEIVSELI